MKLIFEQFQRKLRASLSFYFNKREHENPAYKKIIIELDNLIYESDNKSKKISKKRTHKIFSKKVFNLIKNRNLLNFLQNSDIQKIFFIHNRFFLKKYLNEMHNSKKRNFWKKLLKESNVGNPVRYFLNPFTSGNKIFQTYHLKKYDEFLSQKLRDFKYVFEFGGGYGNMALTFKRIDKKVNYIIFDTFEVSLLQYYYLKKNNLKIEFNKNTKNEINLFSSFEKLKKKLLKLKKIKNKVLIANWSLSETPLSFRKKFEFLYQIFDYQFISFQEFFEGTNNLKYFEKISKINLKNKRNSKIFNIKEMKNHYYLFSKK